MEIIGDFEVGKRIYVVDPCGITEFGAGVDVVSGTWQAQVDRDAQGYITRIEVSIEPVEKFITMGKVIVVDSGQVGFFDEKTLIETLNHERKNFTSIYDSDFYKACSKLTSGREQCGVLDGWAFLTATNGDGGLLLECGLDKDRRIVALGFILLNNLALFHFYASSWRRFLFWPRPHNRIMPSGTIAIFGEQVKAPIQVFIDVSGFWLCDFWAGFCQGGVKGYGDWLR